MSDVFISYAHADADLVGRLAASFTKGGLNVWWDRGEIGLAAGSRFDRDIEKRLSSAKAVVVLWSRISVESDWVFGEADEAKSQGKLVPAQIDDCRIPLAFRRIQAPNLSGWTGDAGHLGYRQVRNAVRIFVGSGDGIDGADGSGFGGGAGESRARPPLGRRWIANLRSFEWTGARFCLSHDKVSYEIEYRNHFKYEAIYLDGGEHLRGGDESRLHPSFRLYLDEHLCVIEPVYSIWGRLFTGRLAMLKVSIDGSPVADFP